MSQIKLQPEEARGHARKIKSQAEVTTQDIGALKSYLSGLKNSFEGQTATEFDARYMDWENSAKQVVEALNQLGDFLEKSAGAIEQLDNEMAAKLRSS